ncbi:GntR family transcriptional regulator [Sulfidibacter corallicola]|uniref:GntR family transcriptional regulator n=1 Tax=Sulfidibacter corallicola TaxID=2818388 RepID=A0A8A4TEK3_SULCO|nr:GntR family transcriptional regulator [Sulfidibacter corallicola]QTD47980.1 GntR family transcriptional regulator [Sulfidibacter corallicola]
MIPFRIRAQSGLPLYRQIADQVQQALLTGKLQPGDKLPSHRELAVKLVVAPLTVKQAYDYLERQGWTETKRGMGTFLSKKPVAALHSEKREALRDTVRKMLEQTRELSMDRQALLDLIDELADGQWMKKEVPLDGHRGN